MGKRFFDFPSARLSFSDDAPVLTSEALTAYAVVQAKVAASDLATINALSAGGFQLAESEVDFCLPIDSVEAVLPAWRVANTADIALLRDAASRVFSQIPRFLLGALKTLPIPYRLLRLAEQYA